MSSEEVAELAQAIHSHADALYESWKKGPDVMRRMEDTLELLANPGLTPKLEHLVSNFVRQDKAKRQQQSTDTSLSSRSRMSRSPSPKLQNFVGVSGDCINNVNLVNGIKKPLPKSILAVVQRFESSPPSVSVIPNQSVTSVPSSSPIQSTILPGIGPVTKNVVWAESSNRQSMTETNFGGQQRPLSPGLINPGNGIQGSNFLNNRIRGNSVEFVSMNKGIGREIHIPIQRIEDDGTTLNILQGRAQNSVRNDNLNINQGSNSHSSPPPVIKDLEREEERLFRALRTGQVIPPNEFTNQRDRHLQSFQEKTASNLNNNSRIAFAKERIRHSQEHPLTQQRLELQKRLPSPSSNLAAGVAAQQGRNKFQQPSEVDGAHDKSCHNNGIGGGNYVPPYSHLDEERENTSAYGGRQSWVLRFGSGSSVAERVQLFEKYPSHMVNHNGNGGNEHQFQAHDSYYPGSVSASVFKTNHIHSPKEIMHSISMASTPGDVNHYLHTQPSIGLNLSQNMKGKSTSTLGGNGVTVPWRSDDAHNLDYKPDALENLKRPKKKTTARTPSDEIYKEQNVPRFHWPEGKPPPTSNLVEAISKADDEFSKLAVPLVYVNFGKLLVSIGIPLYWKKPFWTSLGLKTDGMLDKERFIVFYRRLISECPDDASRFMRLLWVAAKKNAEDSENNNDVSNVTYNSKSHLDKISSDPRHTELTMSDFIPMIQDIIDTHPGLGFLRDAPEFHSRYVTTVISRIYYKVNRSWTGRITLSELRRSNVLRVIKRLEEETDVNAITEYFSYEHFYVIYCKFWELDKDHDLLIDKNDLADHGQQALSKRIIDRIFSGTVIRGWDMGSPVKCAPGKMTYSDFVWFLISEEDKKTHTAIEYWFRCLDIDGDGILTPYELQHFYSEQERRIESLSIEPLDFSNVYCQIVDMLRCSPNGIRLQDLKKNPHLASNVFNTLFNLDKYLDHEQRDPFASAGPSQGFGLDITDGESDWDKYAAGEYDHLIAEESPCDHLHENSDFEDGLAASFS